MYVCLIFAVILQFK